jgi:hypothetical protein
MAIARSPELSSSPRHEVFTLLVEAYERRRLFALSSKVGGKFWGYRWQVDTVRWTISQKGDTERTRVAGISIPDLNVFPVQYLAGCFSLI